MSVTKDDVYYVANLARLQLDYNEAESLQKDMNNILGYIETLNELDTADGEPIEQGTEVISTEFRKD